MVLESAYVPKIFQLPITYLTDKQLIKSHIKADLELIALKEEKSH